jgi:hypothetical protein
LVIIQTHSKIHGPNNIKKAVAYSLYRLSYHGIILQAVRAGSGVALCVTSSETTTGNLQLANRVIAEHLVLSRVGYILKILNSVERTRSGKPTEIQIIGHSVVPVPGIFHAHNSNCFSKWNFDYFHTRVRSESFCALWLRYVDLVFSIEVAVKLCCCFTVFSY